MSGTIEQRTDVNPERGVQEYGDVEFADMVNHKYPIDTPEHIRAAHSYLNHQDNADQYRPDDVKQMKERIHHAAEKHGITLTTD